MPQTAQPSKNQAINLGTNEGAQQNHEHFISTLQAKASFENAPETNYLEDVSNHHPLKEDSTLKSLFQPSTVQQERPRRAELKAGNIHTVIKTHDKSQRDRVSFRKNKTSIQSQWFNQTQNSIFSNQSNSICLTKVDPQAYEGVLMHSIAVYNQEVKPAQSFGLPQQRKPILIKKSNLE